MRHLRFGWKPISPEPSMSDLAQNGFALSESSVAGISGDGRGPGHFRSTRLQRTGLS
jgi:hypothetical protein